MRVDEELDGSTYGVLNGPHISPRWTKSPLGPQPTRNDRPSVSPASTIAPSLPLTVDAEVSMRAYF